VCKKHKIVFFLKLANFLLTSKEKSYIIMRVGNVLQLSVPNISRLFFALLQFLRLQA
jgi:hypothetical protein